MHSLHHHQNLHSRRVAYHPAQMAPRSDAVRMDMTPNHSQPLDPAAYTHGLLGVEQGLNHIFENVLVVTFLGLCALTLVIRLANMGNAHLRHISVIGNPTQQAFWTNNHTRWWPALKRHLLLAPLWRNRHNREIQISSAVTVGTLPSRFHTLLLVTYVLSNVAYCLVLPYDRPETGSVLAALRGRTGGLAALNLIPTVLFALRNNPLIPILRVSYDTFNLLHRWTARMVVVEAVAHTVAWWLNTHEAAGWHGVAQSLADTTSYRWGMVGTVVLLFVTVQAWSPLRHAFYETFVNVHRLLVALGLVGVFVHLDAHGLPQVPWLKLVFALWGLEWLARAARICYHNVSARSVTRVTVEALPGEACRLTFDLVRPWTPRPGCHVHVYLPTVSLWASHPFSVAWTETQRPAPPAGEKLPTAAGEPAALGRPADVETSVSLVVRARTGMTRTLFDRASAAPAGRLTTWGAAEGPYGGHEPLDSYGTLLLFAGGVGITHQVGRLRALLAGAAAGTAAARRVTLVWSVANTEALEWVRPWMDEVLRMEGRREILKILLFVTKPRSQREVASGTGSVHMFPGRCNPRTIVDREVGERVGAMCVTVCGPGAFADSVRSAARRRVQAGSVDFIEEAFTY